MVWSLAMMVAVMTAVVWSITMEAAVVWSMAVVMSMVWSITMMVMVWIAVIVIRSFFMEVIMIDPATFFMVAFMHESSHSESVPTMTMTVGSHDNKDSCQDDKLD